MKSHVSVTIKEETFLHLSLNQYILGCLCALRHLTSRDLGPHRIEESNDGDVATKADKDRSPRGGAKDKNQSHFTVIVPHGAHLEAEF